MNTHAVTHLRLRSKLNLDLYFEDAVAQRWLLDFYRGSLCSDIGDGSHPVSVTIVPKPAVLTASQKYRAAFGEATKLATLVSEVSMEKYKQRLNVLRDLVRLWEDHQDAGVVNIEDEVSLSVASTVCALV